MDANGDGVVEKDELRNLLKGLGEQVDDAVIDEMMSIADTDGDGKVNFEEFVKASTTEEWTCSQSDDWWNEQKLIVKGHLGLKIQILSKLEMIKLINFTQELPFSSIFFLLSFQILNYLFISFRCAASPFFGQRRFSCFLVNKKILSKIIKYRATAANTVGDLGLGPIIDIDICNHDVRQLGVLWSQMERLEFPAAVPASHII